MFQSRDIPNLITLLRILLVVPIIWLLWRQEFAWALGLFAVAGISDGLDGWLAKHYGWQSRLGSLLDPMADKLLLVFSYLTLGFLGLLPGWLVLLVVLRDVVIVSGALAYHVLVETLSQATPTLVSKLNTTVQILLVLGVMFDHGVRSFPEGTIPVLIWITTITILWSGIEYVWIWSRRAREVQHNKP